MYLQAHARTKSIQDAFSTVSDVRRLFSFEEWNSDGYAATATNDTNHAAAPCP